MDKLCVVLENETIAKVTVTGVRRDESLEDAMLRVLIEEWKWLREDMERYGNLVEHFLLDPDVWSWLKRIRWPTVRRNADEPAVLFHRNCYCVNLCRIRTYQACKMHWSHKRFMYYAARSNRNRGPCRTDPR